MPRGFLYSTFVAMMALSAVARSAGNSVYLLLVM